MARTVRLGPPLEAARRVVDVARGPARHRRGRELPVRVVRKRGGHPRFVGDRLGTSGARVARVRRAQVVRRVEVAVHVVEEPGVVPAARAVVRVDGPLVGLRPEHLAQPPGGVVAELGHLLDRADQRVGQAARVARARDGLEPSRGRVVLVLGQRVGAGGEPAPTLLRGDEAREICVVPPRGPHRAGRRARRRIPVGVSVADASLDEAALRVVVEGGHRTVAGGLFDDASRGNAAYGVPLEAGSSSATAVAGDRDRFVPQDASRGPVHRELLACRGPAGPIVADTGGIGFDAWRVGVAVHHVAADAQVGRAIDDLRGAGGAALRARVVRVVRVAEQVRAVVRLHREHATVPDGRAGVVVGGGQHGVAVANHAGEVRGHVAADLAVLVVLGARRAAHAPEEGGAGHMREGREDVRGVVLERGDDRKLGRVPYEVQPTITRPRRSRCADRRCGGRRSSLRGGRSNR